MHFQNFINSGLDYDPEISVLFDGGGSGGGGGNCSSDDYSIVQDYVFWASLGCAIGALCCICLILTWGSTRRGQICIRGRKSATSALRDLRKSAAYADESVPRIL